MNKEILLKIENLKYLTDKKQILNIEKLTINKGNIVSILGPSGAGKTTFLKLISGLAKPNTGTIKMNKENIGFIFQNFNLYESISVYKNIYLSAINSTTYRYDFFASSIAKYNKDNKNNHYIEKLLKKYTNKKTKGFFHYYLLVCFLLMNFKFEKSYFKIFHVLNIKKKINNDIKLITEKLQINHILKNNSLKISGGQQQRVSIAKALIKKANIILMDEPFASLDANIKEESKDWIKNIQKEFNLSIFIVTHDKNDAMLISDEILFINQGELLQHGSVDYLVNNPKNFQVANFFNNFKNDYLYKENENYYYLKKNALKVIKSSESKNYIVSKKTLNGLFLYEIYSQKFNKNIEWLSDDNSFEINDFVATSIKKDDIFVFNKTGERVYEK
ncbi:ATP-binding cassette domain-containing protein [Mycoplasmopsis alligatoris]|uniref:ABC transporter, ATP-binding protein n=1 Tax=Mycoplasmopsis alligatoris A21JP2 TaxID=747682 RepID=D4XV47_9BACT|nr:ABC transporter ATP-binding protein [Mycoplasmopsis alligatoris]EFF41792.1 ABC transporter, ATP-binding protein [Mycoplasmopsis alligatoris A21JP2]